MTTSLLVADQLEIIQDSVPRKKSAAFFQGTMPLPPGINQSYKIVEIETRDYGPIKRLGDSAVSEQFKADAALMLSQAYCDWPLVVAIRESKKKVPLIVEIKVYFPTMWKRDLDGVEKHAMDAAFARINKDVVKPGLLLNDNQVVRKITDKFVDSQDPRLEIEISCALSSR